MRLPLQRAQTQGGLANWVSESLRESILRGHFVPGERLDQLGISQDLEVSLTPVREALRRLEAGGFVEIRPRHGVFIPRPTPQDIHEIYDIRKQLEPEILLRLVPTVPMTTLEELDSMLARAEQRLNAGDVEGYFDCDLFDETVRQLTSNRMLREWLGALNSRIMIIRRFNEFQPGPHLAESLGQHREILAAARNRDAHRAAQLMLEHLEQAESRVRCLATTSDKCFEREVIQNQTPNG